MISCAGSSFAQTSPSSATSTPKEKNLLMITPEMKPRKATTGTTTGSSVTTAPRTAQEKREREELIRAFVTANINNPEAIKDARRQYGISITELAKATGFTETEVQAYLSSNGASLATRPVGSNASTNSNGIGAQRLSDNQIASFVTQNLNNYEALLDFMKNNGLKYEDLAKVVRPMDRQMGVGAESKLFSGLTKTLEQQKVPNHLINSKLGYSPEDYITRSIPQTPGNQGQVMSNTNVVRLSPEQTRNAVIQNFKGGVPVGGFAQGINVNGLVQ